MIEKRNLRSGLPAGTDGNEEEFFEVLSRGNGDFKIERIVSRGHSSPPEFWYDQETVEWVVVISGFGKVEFEERGEIIHLEPGDWVEIPAHVRHRVAATSDVEDTVWLAVHWKEGRESDV